MEAVGAVAQERGVPRAHVALAWVRSNPAISAPLVGATSEAQLRDAVDSLSLTLTDEEKARLEAPYVVRRPELY